MVRSDSTDPPLNYGGRTSSLEAALAEWWSETEEEHSVKRDEQQAVERDNAMTRKKSFSAAVRHKAAAIGRWRARRGQKRSSSSVVMGESIHVRDVNVSDWPRQAPPIPEAGHAFVGHWRHVRSEAYGDFLSECVGLNWAIKKIGERIHPTPIFHIDDGKLLCQTICLGAKPVFETFVVGHSQFSEPNQGVDYEVDAWWEAGDSVFVASRQSPAVNAGRPVVKRVYIERATGELHINTSWGGRRDFRASFARR